MIQYKILKAYDNEDLEAEINEAAEDGWTLKNNIIVYELTLLATMFKR